MNYFAEFYTLIWMLEEFYENKRFALKMQSMRHLQKHGFSGLEIEDYDNPKILEVLRNDENIDNEMDLVILESMGIQIFRSYFFVAIYQHFENLLIKLCNEKENNPDLINFRDIYGKNCIDKCKTFLTKVVKIRLPDETPWQKMSNYNKLRNIIVHNRSQIDSSQRGNEILKFAKGNKSLYLLNDLYEDNKEQFEYGEMNDVIDNYEIILEKGFCEEALDDFDLFINSLEDQMKNQPEPT